MGSNLILLVSLEEEEFGPREETEMGNPEGSINPEGRPGDGSGASEDMSPTHI